MGREVRRVPKDWVHPKRRSEGYQPMHDESLAEAQRDWDVRAAQWAKGLMQKSYDKPPTAPDCEWEPVYESLKDMPYAEADGERPGSSPEDAAYYRPDWPEETRTHLQMYENTTEGTPISPVMETPEELARWLTDNEASAFGRMKATYEQWLTTIRRGWSVSMMRVDGRLMSGVEANRKL